MGMLLGAKVGPLTDVIGGLVKAGALGVTLVDRGLVDG
jgi:hypothetical protein